MLSRSLCICWCVLMCASSPARAHQVQLGVEQGLDFNSNAFGLPRDAIQDGVFRFTPTITVEQPDTRFTYFLKYRPTYSAYFDTEGNNGWDQFLVGRGAYQVTGRDNLAVSADFVSIRGIRENSFGNAAGQTQVVPTQPGLTRHVDADIRHQHAFSQRTVGSLGARYDYWDFTFPGRVGNRGYGGDVQLLHQPLGRLRVGLGLDTRYRAFDASSSAPASYSTVLNANVLVKYEFNDRLNLDVSAGPAGVFSQQSEPGPTLVSRWSPAVFDPSTGQIGPFGRVWGPTPAAPPSCGTTLGTPVLSRCALTATPVTGVPGFPGELVLVPVDPAQNFFGRSDRELTYFVSLRLVRRFRAGALDLSFVRNEDGGSGFGAFSVLNATTLTLNWALSDHWLLNLAGSYYLRETFSRFPTTEVAAVPSSASFGGNVLAEAGFVIANPLIQGFEQTVGIAEASLSRQLSEQSRLRLRFQYYNQTDEFASGTFASGFDRFIVGVYYIYQFEPYRF